MNARRNKYINFPASSIALWLVREKFASASCGLLAIIIASEANSKTLQTTIDAKELARLTNQSVDTVRRQLKILVMLGFLIKSKRKGRSNLYTINLSNFEDSEKTTIVDNSVPLEGNRQVSMGTNTHTPCRNLQPFINISNNQSTNKSNDCVDKDLQLGVVAKEIVAAYTDVKPQSIDSSSAKAITNLRQLLVTFTKTDLLISLEIYLTECNESNKEDKYRLNCSNFFSPSKRHFEKYLNNVNAISSNNLNYSVDQLNFINDNIKKGENHGSSL